jgi:hypothetical protein
MNGGLCRASGVRSSYRDGTTSKRQYFDFFVSLVSFVVPAFNHKGHQGHKGKREKDKKDGP